MLLGLEHIHKCGYVYRDLKPENLLVRANGSVCITDFGFAKALSGGERAFTICGTPDYLSPELLLHRGCNRAADIWAFGVLLFEFIAGVPPFRAPTRMELYQKIVDARFDLVEPPKRMDDACMHLLSGILVQDESMRLGMQANGMKGIKHHEWFKKIDWTAVLSGNLRPLHYFPPDASSQHAGVNIVKGLEPVRMANGGWTWQSEPPLNDEENIVFEAW